MIKIVDTESIVCEDIKQRQLKGINKYRTTVANNKLTSREWLQHAYEECLDMAVYLKRLMQELDAVDNAEMYRVRQKFLEEYNKEQNKNYKQLYDKK